MRAESKHGTLLNGEPLPQSLSVPLKHGDKIGLAANIVSLRFSLTPELDQTLDYNCADPLRALPCRNRPSPWSSTPRKSPCWSAARKLRCRRRNGSRELVYKHRNELVTLRLHPHDGLGRTRLLRRQAARSRSRRNKPSPVQTAPQTGRRCEYPQNPPRPGLPPENRLDANIVFGVFPLCNETVIRPLYFFRPAIAKIKARKNYTEECSDEKMLVFARCLRVPA